MELRILNASTIISNYRLYQSPRPSSPFSLGAWQKTNFGFLVSASSDKRINSMQKHAAHSSLAKQRVDHSKNLTIDSIRHSLIRQEDTIIFSLLERAQFCYNADTYDPNVFHMDGFNGSLIEFMVRETEKLHAKLGGYNSPDEHPFFPVELPVSLLPPIEYPESIRRLDQPHFSALNIVQGSPPIKLEKKLLSKLSS